VRRLISKAQVERELEELAEIYVEGKTGKARRETKRTLMRMLRAAAWYGAQCATESSRMAQERLFDREWANPRKI
jgi:hypothetical protein